MTPDLISNARALIGAGKLREAEALCRQLLAKKSRDDKALSLLGVIAFRSNRFADAADFFARAAASDSRNEQYAIDLATSLLRAGRLHDAAAACHHAVRNFPTSANVICEAGNTLLATGRYAEAAETYRKALGSGRPEIHNNLGNALQASRRFSEAISAYREAIRIKPDYLEPHFNLANALSEIFEFQPALAVLHRALELRPNLPEAHLLLGIIYQNLNDDSRATEALHQALRQRPAFAEAELELAKVLLRNDRLDEAVGALRRAIAIKPDFTQAHVFLAHALRESGRHAEAALWARKAGESNDSVAASTFLFSLNYADSIDNDTVLKHHLEWAARFAAPLAAEIKPLTNDRSPERRLRIGYVSPNLSNHPVGRFLLPLLQHHDRNVFEIYCFSDSRKSDVISEQLRKAADVWIDTSSITDAALADLIREHQIDILIDLAMHSPNSRMLTFARRPAPVQLTYLAYAGTTGLATMDYRLTDPHLDPLSQSDSIYMEKSWRLPRTFWCYVEPPEAPAVSPPPIERVGHITFGCLSNFAKVTESALAAWARVLQAVPVSHMILHSPAGQHRDELLARFASADVAPDRIRFMSRGRPDTYFATYRDIDICFDTIGYAGGTTIFDALWMGVPVVTLAGKRSVGRGGVSILTNLGLENLIANDLEEYEAIAVKLAADRDRLGQLRRDLRAMLEHSSLMDAPAFTRDFETALRQMWEGDCATNTR